MLPKLSSSRIALYLLVNFTYHSGNPEGVSLLKCERMVAPATLLRHTNAGNPPHTTIHKEPASSHCFFGLTSPLTFFPLLLRK